MSVSAELCRRFSGFIEIATAWFTVNSVGSLVSTPTITNLSVPTANTEVSHAFGTGTRRFQVQNRTSGLIKFAYAPTGSGSLFVTLFPGAVYEEKDVDCDGLSIYVQSPSAAQTVEILEWS